jgi:hypothetical protein
MAGGSRQERMRGNASDTQTRIRVKAYAPNRVFTRKTIEGDDRLTVMPLQYSLDPPPSRLPVYLGKCHPAAAVRFHLRRTKEGRR